MNLIHKEQQDPSVSADPVRTSVDRKQLNRRFKNVLALFRNLFSYFTFDDTILTV